MSHNHYIIISYTFPKAHAHMQSGLHYSVESHPFLQSSFQLHSDMAERGVYKIHDIVLAEFSISVKRELSGEIGDGGSGDQVPVTAAGREE